MSSYLTISPLPLADDSVSGIIRRGGIFSVALSVGSLPLAVNQHPALWSSDFPRTSRIDDLEGTRLPPRLLTLP